MILDNIDDKVKDILAKEKLIEKKIYNKAMDDKNTVEWQMFYLNNLDVFTEDYLEIPLKHFQRQILLGCWKNDIEVIIASRGLSKIK